ncbi:MAG: glutamate-cysteine ligase family protein [Phycisphaeraceae bacterium]
MSDPASWRYPIGLFEAFGVELEYMIVDRDTLDIRPIADQLFKAAGGEVASDIEPDGPDGTVSWSNELVLHVVEIKTQRPAPSLTGLADAFQSHVNRINDLLSPMNAMLLPTGMHPWMDPSEATLWPHEYTEVYRTYDRIFDCRGHGWSNLQSAHLNLPFRDDDEFGRLHAAVRAVLPLIPAIAASSPLVEGKRGSHLDSRLDFYAKNARRIPMMTGLVIPEPVFTRNDYEQQILQRLYDDLCPHDPEGILRHEFANARGAMARFDRGAIEVRLVDLQECPLADLAILAQLAEVIRALTEDRWADQQALRDLSTETLHHTLEATIHQAEAAVIADPSLLRVLGVNDKKLKAQELWLALHEQTPSQDTALREAASKILHSGSLSTRILKATEHTPDLRTVYRLAAESLSTGQLLTP